jgi:hypothetical protein
MFAIFIVQNSFQSAGGDFQAADGSYQASISRSLATHDNHRRLLGLEEELAGIASLLQSVSYIVVVLSMRPSLVVANTEINRRLQLSLNPISSRYPGDTEPYFCRKNCNVVTIASGLVPENIFLSSLPLVVEVDWFFPDVVVVVVVVVVTVAAVAADEGSSPSVVDLDFLLCRKLSLDLW